MVGVLSHCTFVDSKSSYAVMCLLLVEFGQANWQDPVAQDKRRTGYNNKQSTASVQSHEAGTVYLRAGSIASTNQGSTVMKPGAVGVGLNIHKKMMSESFKGGNEVQIKQGEE